MKDQSPSPCFSLHVQPRTAIAAARFLKEDPPQLDDGMLGVRAAPGNSEVAQVHTDTSPSTVPWHDRTSCQEVWCLKSADFFTTVAEYQIRDNGDPSQGPEITEIADYYDDLSSGPTHYAKFNFTYTEGEPGWSTDSAVKDLTGVAFRVYNDHPFTSSGLVAWMYRHWDATNASVKEFWVLKSNYVPPKYASSPNAIYVSQSETSAADVEAFVAFVDDKLGSDWDGVYTTVLSAVVTAF